MLVADTHINTESYGLGCTTYVSSEETLLAGGGGSRSHLPTGQQGRLGDTGGDVLLLEEHCLEEMG